MVINNNYSNIRCYSIYARGTLKDMPNSTGTLDEGLVTKAVQALQKYHATVTAQRKRKLVDDNPLISVIIAVKAIPQKKMRPVQIQLLHSLYPHDEYTTCLITKDDKRAVKQRLEAKSVTGITKVISVEKLGTDYKSFEAKRKLSASYDLFLCDKRVYGRLSTLLGKKFFEKKKFPFAVDMRKVDLAGEIRRAINSTYLHVGHGSCMAVPVARVGFPTDAVVGNILQCAKTISNKLSRGLAGIQSINIKTADSIALPIFNSLPKPATVLSEPGETSKAKRVKLEVVEETGQACDMEACWVSNINPVTSLSHDAGVKTPEKACLTKKSKTPKSKYSAKKVKGSTVLKSVRSQSKHARKSM